MLAVKYMQKEALKKGNIEVTRTYKGKGSSGWTGIDNNVINNKLMTIQARFILIYLLSKNESKDYIDQEIIAENCNLSTKQVSRYLFELKQFKHLEIVKSDKPNKKGHYDYKYRLIEGSSVLPVDINHRTYTSSGKKTNKTSVKHSDNKQLEDIKPLDTIGHEPHDIDVRFLYNTIINNTDDNTKKNHHEISDLENVENSLIEFADKADEDKIRNEFDNLLDGRLEIQSNLIDALKKKSSDFRKVRPVAETIELIKLLPEFVKASKLKNTDKNYEDKQSLTYLVKILENPLGNYPKWFLDSQKQEVVNNKVADMETVWKQTVKIWDCHYAGRIDDCIKKMVEKILNFVIESENYKKAGKPDNVFLSRFRGVFNQSCTNTLEVKKLSEMIEIINEYINKSWNKSDVFCEVIENFTKNGYSLETIESYFLQNKAGV